MYEIENAEVAAAIESNCRTFRALIEFADGSIVSGADIGTADIEHTAADDGAITFGRIISKRAEIKLYCGRKVRKGEFFRLYLYLLDFGGTVGTERTTHRMLRQWQHRELSLLTQNQISYAGRSKNTDGTVLGNCYIPMGEFAAVKCVTEGLSQTVTAYDNGVYTTFFIGSSGTVYDPDKLDEPSLGENNVSVAGITCEVDGDTVLAVGEFENAYTVSVICPYMTGERLKQIWSEMRYLSWRPADASERLADPRRDIGDLMYYDSSEGRCRLPVTSLTFHFNGGLSADVSSCGQVETYEAEELFVMTSTIADMELLTIAELQERTIAEIQG